MKQKKKRDALGIPGDRYAEYVHTGVQEVGKSTLPKDLTAYDNSAKHAFIVINIHDDLNHHYKV